MDDPTTPEPEASEAPAPRRRPFRLPEEIGVIVALLVMVAVIGVARPRFLNPINLLTILGNTTFQGMLSLGMVFLLAIREIDLSVGWMFNFSAVVAALMMVAGVNPWLAALGGVGFGAVLGLVNGVLAIGLGCLRSSSRSAPIRCSRDCRSSLIRVARCFRPTSRAASSASPR